MPGRAGLGAAVIDAAWFLRELISSQGSTSVQKPASQKSKKLVGQSGLSSGRRAVVQAGGWDRLQVPAPGPRALLFCPAMPQRSPEHSGLKATPGFCGLGWGNCEAWSGEDFPGWVIELVAGAAQEKSHIWWGRRPEKAATEMHWMYCLLNSQRAWESTGPRIKSD